MKRAGESPATRGGNGWWLRIRGHVGSTPTRHYCWAVVESQDGNLDSTRLGPQPRGRPRGPGPRLLGRGIETDCDRRGRRERREKGKVMNDGGRAFPVPDYADKEGMSLRDYYKGQALAGILANKGLVDRVVRSTNGGAKEIENLVACLCAGYADALLAEKA